MERRAIPRITEKMTEISKKCVIRGRRRQREAVQAGLRAGLRAGGQLDRRESGTPMPVGQAPGRADTRQVDAGAALAPGRQVPHLRAAYLSSASIRR